MIKHLKIHGTHEVQLMYKHLKANNNKRNQHSFEMV